MSTYWKTLGLAALATVAFGFVIPAHASDGSKGGHGGGDLGYVFAKALLYGLTDHAAYHPVNHRRHYGHHGRGGHHAKGHHGRKHHKYHHAKRRHHGKHGYYGGRHSGHKRHGHHGRRHHKTGHYYDGYGCRTVYKMGYHHGDRVKYGGTLCYDSYGEPYIVPGSRYVAEYYYY